MPPGVPELAETVSEKVTEEPKLDGLGDEVRTEVVESVEGSDHLAQGPRGRAGEVPVGVT